MSASQVRKKKKRKFRKVTIKLSQKERKAIEYCMLIESLTLNKFIKSAIREKLHGYRDRINEMESNMVSENQLSLFPEEEEQDNDS